MQNKFSTLSYRAAKDMISIHEVTLDSSAAKYEVWCHCRDHLRFLTSQHSKRETELKYSLEFNSRLISASYSMQKTSSIW